MKYAAPSLFGLPFGERPRAFSLGAVVLLSSFFCLSASATQDEEKNPEVDAAVEKTAVEKTAVEKTAVEKNAVKKTEESKKVKKKRKRDAKKRILIMGLTSKGVEQDVVDTITDYMAVVLQADPKLDVITGADMKQLMALEEERVQVGCSDDTSCMAEIAGALGAELVIFGQAGRLGSLLLINLSLFDSIEAKAVARVSVQAKNVEEIPALLEPALGRLVSETLGGAPISKEFSPAPAVVTSVTQPEEPSEEQEGSGSLLGIGLVGGGVLVASTGVVLSIIGALVALEIEGLEEDYRNDNTELTRAELLKLGQENQAIYPWLLYGGAAVAAIGIATAATGGFLALSE